MKLRYRYTHTISNHPPVVSAYLYRGWYTSGKYAVLARTGACYEYTN